MMRLANWLFDASTKNDQIRTALPDDQVRERENEKDRVHVCERLWKCVFERERVIIRFSCDWSFYLEKKLCLSCAATNTTKCLGNL